MRTAWVNRSAVSFDTIGGQPDLTVRAVDRLAAALDGGGAIAGWRARHGGPASA